MNWPPMSAVHRQTQRDINAPIRSRPVGFGLVETRVPPFFEVRTEYGMGHAWRTVKVGRFKLWLRVEDAR